MAKTKRYRKYYKKGRWSANIQELNHQDIPASAGPWSATTTLATNPSQSTLGVSQTYTVKNVEINFTIEGNLGSNSSSIEAVTAYIMYVPQGMNVGENYNLEHPEYILTYKYLGSPTFELTADNPPIISTQQYQPFRVKTRMSRRLQTGDSIILFIKGFNQTNTEVSMQLSGLVRWWTKAN